MKIAVISAFDFSQKKAWALNSIKMAEGFALNGHEVHVICRKCKHKSISTEDFLQSYGVKEKIYIHTTPYWTGDAILFAIFSAFYLLKNNIKFVYARNYIAPILSALIGINTTVESHAHPGNRNPYYKIFTLGMRFLPHLKKWITISPYLKNHYIKDLKIPQSKIQVLPDAVDTELFRKPEALPASSYPEGNHHIAYAGHLYDYKGIPTVLKCAQNMPENVFHFIGGFAEDIERHKIFCKKNNIENIVFHGYISHKDVPNYLWHANALLLPPSLNHPSAHWTSPMKLGEYMLSGTPIICSNIPALQHWVTNNEVLFFEADNAQSLKLTIQETLSKSQKKRIKASQKIAEKMSYKNRSKEILN